MQQVALPALSTFASSVLHSKGISLHALDVAFAAEDHQALVIGDDVLYGHGRAVLSAHHSAPVPPKLVCNLLCLCLYNSKHLVAVLQQAF